jgi:hypothetical protein
VGSPGVCLSPAAAQVWEWQGDRWSWFMPTRTSLVVADLSRAPTLKDAALPWAAVGSYIGLSRVQFDVCSRGLTRIGEPYDGT